MLSKELVGHFTPFFIGKFEWNTSICLSYGLFSVIAQKNA